MGTTPKAIIERIFSLRSDYKDPSQSANLANSLDIISGDIYSEGQRFIYELIQNADDASDDSENIVQFAFIEDNLIISHKGREFSEQDIDALTKVGDSTKKNEKNQTGYKGIGFKSVFGRSTNVTIISGGYQFRFQRDSHPPKTPWQIIPLWTELSELNPKVSAYLKENHFSVSTIIQTDEIESLSYETIQLLENCQILLFLRKLSKITIVKNGITTLSISKELETSINDLYIYALVNNKNVSSKWMLIQFTNITIPEEIKSKLQTDPKVPAKLKDLEQTSISFAAKMDGNHIRQVQGNESLIYTYLPTKVTEYRFPFLINGSFLTNAPREAIHEDNIWNHFLFQTAAKHLIKWLELIAKSPYKFEVLNLIPSSSSMVSGKNATFFKNSFNDLISDSLIITTLNGGTSTPRTTVIDQTGIASESFIPQKLITDFFNIETNSTNDTGIIVHPKLSSNKILKEYGTNYIDLDNFENLIKSDLFKSSHKIAHNIQLIKFFFNHSLNDKSGHWKNLIYRTPFIFDKNQILRKPSTEICFPSESTDAALSEVPTIHESVFSDIQANNDIYNWLTDLGVKVPSEMDYITKVIIPNLSDPNYINEGNYKKLTLLLFQHFNKNQLSAEILEKLSSFRLRIEKKTVGFAKANNCFLHTQYGPKIPFGDLIPELPVVSKIYGEWNNDISQWKRFFERLQVIDDIKIKHITQNNSVGELKELTDPEWTKACQDYVDNTIPHSFGFSDHNLIENIRIPSFLKKSQTIYDYSKIFWEKLMPISDNLELLTSEATLKYGQGRGRNMYSYKVENYFPWFIKTNNCFPTLNKQLHIPSTVFLDSKEIIEIGKSDLPVTAIPNIPKEWATFLGLRKELTPSDLLQLLTKISQESKKNKKLNITRDTEKRIGLIYNKLCELLPEIQNGEIEKWAINNQLLSSNGTFVNPHELIHLAIEGFNLIDQQIKTVKIPGNLEKDQPNIKDLLTQFGIKIIEDFDFKCTSKRKEVGIQQKFYSILPILATINAKKKYLDIETEYHRMVEKVNTIHFFSADQISISFRYNDEDILGPLLPILFTENELITTGKWKSERILIDLIRELSAILDIGKIKDELRFLLLEDDVAEVKIWLKHQGITIPELQIAALQIEYDLENHDPTEKYVSEAEIEYNLEALENTKMEDSSDGKEMDAEATSEQLEKNSTPFIPQKRPNEINMNEVLVTDFVTNQTNFSPVKLSKLSSTIKDESVRIEIGKWSEELIYNFILKNSSAGTKVVWMNKEGEQGLPYDIKTIKDGKEGFVEVKGTPSDSKEETYFSKNEWQFMISKGDAYSIYKVFDAGKIPRIAKIENPGSKVVLGELLPESICLLIP